MHVMRDKTFWKMEHVKIVKVILENKEVVSTVHQIVVVKLKFLHLLELARFVQSMREHKVMEKNVDLISAI